MKVKALLLLVVSGSHGSARAQTSSEDLLEPSFEVGHNFKFPLSTYGVQKHLSFQKHRPVGHPGGDHHSGNANVHFGLGKSLYGSPLAHFGTPGIHPDHPGFVLGHPDKGHVSSEEHFGIGSLPLQPHQGVCAPKYLTKYETAYKEVPIYKTLISKSIVPSPIYNTQYVTQYQTEYVPKYVTSTKYVPKLKYVTAYKPVHHTQYKTEFVPKEIYSPKYVTKHHYITTYITDVVYKTLYHTQYQPKYLTQTVYQTDVQYNREYIPAYVTVTKHHPVLKTVCSDEENVS